MEVAEGLDTGAVHARATIPLTGDDTTESVWSTLSDIGADLLVAQLRDGLGEPVEQVGEITYAKKLSTDDLRIDWTAPAVMAERVVRVGGAHTTFRGARVKVLAARVVDGRAEPGVLVGTSVGTGDALLQLLEVQPEGRARMRAEDWRNGARVVDGEVLGA